LSPDAYNRNYGRFRKAPLISGTYEKRSMTIGNRDGILLVGHGTRDPAGAGQFLATAEALRAALPERLIEPCFLEILEPDVAEGCRRLVERGARQVAVMPLLLLAAGHARRDIPAILRRIAGDHPGIPIRQCSHLGSSELLDELSLERYRQALAGRGAIAAQDTLLVLVARGTTDREAILEMQQFARRRAAHSLVGRVEVCFAAVAEPSLSTVLAQAAELPFARVVVQPHLLFGGLVLAGIKKTLETFVRGRGGDRQWLLAQPLGPSPALVRAVADLLVDVQPRLSNALAVATVQQ